MKVYSNSYGFDKGLNLIQRTGNSGQTRMIVASHSNRAINRELYDSLGLNPRQKTGLHQTFVNENIFDKAGNQLKSVANDSLGWDYRSMLQSTSTILKDEEGTITGALTEYNLYAKTGRRNRKVTERTNETGKVVEIKEALYLGNLEYRSTWVGNDLSYNGEVVSQNNQPKSPQEAYVALRIHQGHKQVSEKRVYTYKEGGQVNDIASFFSLDNNIDSCEMQLNEQGDLESYYSSKPYGETAVSYGKSLQHPYKYSGQEKDQSGLYYYGYRSLLPQNFRWMSPDPAGVRGSQLNWYAMVRGNPISLRDEMGLADFGENVGRAVILFALALVSVVAFGIIVLEQIIGLPITFAINTAKGNALTRNHYRDFNNWAYGTENTRGRLTGMFRTEDKSDFVIDANVKKHNRYCCFDNAAVWAAALLRGIPYYSTQEAGNYWKGRDVKNPDFQAYWQGLERKMAEKGDDLNIMMVAHGNEESRYLIESALVQLDLALKDNENLDFRTVNVHFCSCRYGAKGHDWDTFKGRLKFKSVKVNKGTTTFIPWWRGVSGFKRWTRHTRPSTDRTNLLTGNDDAGQVNTAPGNELAIEMSPISSTLPPINKPQHIEETATPDETENLKEDRFVD